MSAPLSAASFNCPNCQAIVQPDDSTCRSCGADIQFIALAAQRAILEHMLDGGFGPAPHSAEELVPRLGDYLVQQGLVTSAQLIAALAEQANATPAGPRRLIGQTLVDQGALSADALHGAIAGRLHELQSSLLYMNRSLEQRVVDRTAELHATVARLAEFNQLKTNFVANISHELRTPLTHIKGYNVLLRDGALGPLSPDQRQAVATTESAVTRLEQLIEDLISYAAAVRGELTLHLRPVPAAQVIDQSLGRSASKASRHRVTLEHKVAEELPPVLADEEKLTWTLLQLIDNGVKFTPVGGAVTVSAFQREQHVIFSVRDSGIGIPAQRFTDIFEPFQQLDGSTTRRFAGTGLGLALVRRILDAHGVQMHVESQEGRGSTFSFAMPCLGR